MWIFWKDYCTHTATTKIKSNIYIGKSTSHEEIPIYLRDVIVLIEKYYADGEGRRMQGPTFPHSLYHRTLDQHLTAHTHSKKV